MRLALAAATCLRCARSSVVIASTPFNCCRCYRAACAALPGLSGATFRIFPKEDLVVVMTRNDRGKYRPGTSFNGYHEKFLNLITASVQP